MVECILDFCSTYYWAFVYVCVDLITTHSVPCLNRDPCRGALSTKLGHMHNIDGKMRGYMIWCRLHQYAFDVAIPARGILKVGLLARADILELGATA
jgi:hypothetical protein